MERARPLPPDPARQAIDGGGDAEAERGRGVRHAQDDDAARRQRRADPVEHAVLAVAVEVMQHVEEHDRVRRPEGGGADVVLVEPHADASGVTRALDVALGKVDAVKAPGSRRRRPCGGPRRGLVAAGGEERREHALAATQVDHARGTRDHARFEQVAEDRVARELSKGEMPREAIARPIAPRR